MKKKGSKAINRSVGGGLALIVVGAVTSTFVGVTTSYPAAPNSAINSSRNWRCCPRGHRRDDLSRYKRQSNRSLQNYSKRLRLVS